MLNIAKKRLKGRKIKLLKKDMEDLNLSDKFDIIVSNGNIHYIKNIEGFIQKCKSLLKENGQLILVDWSKDYLLFRVLKIYWKFRIKPFTQIYTMEEIKDRLTKTGFAAQQRAVRKYEKNHPERRNLWVQAKKLPTNPCEVCGEKFTHRHHPDISKPLQIIYLCPLHHRQIHINLV